MPISFSIDDLLTYTDWDRTKWHEWFREQGPKALAVDLGANNNGNIHNVGQLVRHIFAAEKRYVERCLKTTLTDPTSISAEDVEAMFAFGVTGRQALRDLLASFTEWEALREMQFSPTNIRIVTPRKPRPGEIAGIGDRALLRIQEGRDDDGDGDRAERVTAQEAQHVRAREHREELQRRGHLLLDHVERAALRVRVEAVDARAHHQLALVRLRDVDVHRVRHDDAVEGLLVHLGHERLQRVRLDRHVEAGHQPIMEINERAKNATTGVDANT